MFHKELKRRIVSDDVASTNTKNNWRDLVQLPQYAAFCTFRLLLACVGIPIVGQIQEWNEELKQYPLDLFVVFGIAVLSLIIDLMAFDIRRLSKLDAKSMSAEHKEPLLNGNDTQMTTTMMNAINEDESMEAYDAHGIELSGIGTATSASSTTNGLKELNALNDTIDTRVTHETFQTYDSNQLLYDKMKLKVETFAIDALWELPWKLVPFVFGLFIIVGYMDSIGFVDFLARALMKIAESENESIWLPMFLVGASATFLCQIVNNQPMTVLMATVLERVSALSDEKDLKWLNGAYFALAIGANFGGNSTPIASLAVLMWRGILQIWNIKIKYVAFSKKGIAITPLLVFSCILVVALQSEYFGF